MKHKAYTLYLPEQLVKDIEKYQTENYIATRNATILQLITSALREHKPKGEEDND